MFFTLGIIIGFVLGWFLNDKWDWVKARAKEISSWSGLSLIVLGGLIILGGPFVNLLAWAAVAWGIFSIWKKD